MACLGAAILAARWSSDAWHAPTAASHVADWTVRLGLPVGLLLAVTAGFLTARTVWGYLLVGSVVGLVVGFPVAMAGMSTSAWWSPFAGGLGLLLCAPAIVLGLLSPGRRSGRPRGLVAWLMRKDDPQGLDASPRGESVPDDGVVHARSAADARHRERAKAAKRRAGSR